MRKPKYQGFIRYLPNGKCFCNQNQGKGVWMWTAPVQGASMVMSAHVKCFRNLWRGEF